MIRADLASRIGAVAAASLLAIPYASAQSTQNPPNQPLFNVPPSAAGSQGRPVQPTPAPVPPAAGTASQPSATTQDPSAGIATTSAVVTSPVDDSIAEFDAGYFHQFDAEIHNGGTMSADRFFAGLSARLVKSQDFTLTLAMGYEFDWYHWNGANTLGGTTDPFGSVNLFAMQLRGRFVLSKEFSVGVGAIFGIAGETNAEAGDSLYGGGIGSFLWTPNDNLMLGIGLLGVTQIEGGPLILPIPIINWKITPEFTLTTIRHPPASPMVNLDFIWNPTNMPLEASIGMAWQDRRFRLGPNSKARLNNGVGEDTTWNMTFGFGYKFTPDIRLDVYTGLNFWESITVRNSIGAQQNTQLMDPSALLGLYLTIKF